LEHVRGAGGLRAVVFYNIWREKTNKMG